MKFAEAFQDWVEEELLPSIRKTGSYSLAAPVPAQEDKSWQSKRLEGKELTKLKHASLKALIAGGFGQTGASQVPDRCQPNQSSSFRLRTAHQAV